MTPKQTRLDEVLAENLRLRTLVDRFSENLQSILRGVEELAGRNQGSRYFYGETADNLIDKIKMLHNAVHYSTPATNQELDRIRAEVWDEAAKHGLRPAFPDDCETGFTDGYRQAVGDMQSLAFDKAAQLRSKEAKG